MRVALLLGALAIGGGALGASAAPSAFGLAGRYTYSFRNGDVSGEHYHSTDVLEIVARDRTHAVFDIHLNFFNGHECSLSGDATLEGDILVYRETAPQSPGEPICVFRLWRERGRLRWSDGENSCRAYCGARGSLMSGDMAWSSRRPISRAQRNRFLRSDGSNSPNP